MDQLTEKTFKTSRSHTYRYYIRKSSDSNKPALLFCHGFPDDAHLWAKIVPALLPLDFTLVIPDLLGYGGTSKPTDPNEYNGKLMANDLYEILDDEQIKQIIPVGHDWGSFMAQRAYLWNPERSDGLILLNVAYRPPSQEPFDLQATNELTERLVGYPLYAYWELFTAPDGAKVVHSHLESLYTALHGDAENWMKTMFCVPGAFRKYLEEDKTVSVKEFAKDPAFKKYFLERFQRDGFDGPLCWYRATKDNVQYNQEKDLLNQDFVINKPVLFIGASGDAVCLTAAIHQVKPLLPDLVVDEVQAGHWSPYETPKAVSDILVNWLKEKFP